MSLTSRAAVGQPQVQKIMENADWQKKSSNVFRRHVHNGCYNGRDGNGVLYFLFCLVGLLTYKKTPTMTIRSMEAWCYWNKKYVSHWCTATCCCTAWGGTRDKPAARKEGRTFCFFIKKNVMCRIAVWRHIYIYICIYRCICMYVYVYVCMI